MRPLLPCALLVLCACEQSKSEEHFPTPPLETAQDTGLLPSDSPPVDTAEETPPVEDCSTRAVVVDGVFHATLQEGLDAAGDGALVEICPGVHAGTFRATVPVKIAGVGGDPSAVVLDGGASGTTLSLVAGSAVRSLTLTGGRAPSGGGLSVSGPGTLVVENCIVRDNQATSDGGGGLYLGPGLQAELTRTSIHGNVASNGGGIWLDGATLQADEISEIYENRSSGCGGGIYAEDASLQAGIVRNNQGVLGAGLCVIDSTVKYTEVRENEAVGPYYAYAGGVWAYGGVTLIDMEVVGNRAPDGAGVLAEPGTDLQVLGGEISGNVGESGAGVFVSDEAVALIEGSAIEDNVAEGLGGGLWVSGTVQVIDSQVLRNASSDAGGAYIEGDTLSFESIATSWGLEADDNVPADVALFVLETLSFVSFDYGSDATFTCTGDICSSESP